MADPIISDAVVEGGKNVGNAGGLLALGYMVVNVFKKKVEVDDEREAKALEAVAAELKMLNTSVGEMKSTLGILTERVSNTRADMDEVKQENKALQVQVAELRGRLDHLSEQLQIAR